MVNKKQLKRQLLNLRNDLTEIKELVKELENKNGEYKEELAKARADYAEVCSRYQKTRSELLKAEGRIKEAEDADRMAKELLAKKDKELAKAKKALDNANKENALLKQELAETKEQLAKAEEKGNEFDEIVRNINNQINALKAKIDIFDGEIGELEISATEHCAAIDEFNESIENSNNPVYIRAQKNAKLDCLRSKAEIENNINSKRNVVEAKFNELSGLKLTLKNMFKYKEK